MKSLLVAALISGAVALACGPSAPVSSPSTQSPVAATATPARTASPTAATATATARVIVAPSAPAAATGDYLGIGTVVSFEGDTARVALKETGEVVSVRIGAATVVEVQGSMDAAKWKTFAETKVAPGDTVGLVFKGSNKTADGAFILTEIIVPKK